MTMAPSRLPKDGNERTVTTLESSLAQPDVVFSYLLVREIFELYPEGIPDLMLWLPRAVAKR
jgi:hypothetical protein